MYVLRLHAESILHIFQLNVMDTPEIKYRVSSPSLLSTCKLVLLEKLKQFT